MYLDWFKLTRLPFRLRPDPEFLYAGGGYAPVLAALRSAVESGRGLLLLLGEPGTGKTTLLNALALERSGTQAVARIQLPDLSPRELLESLEAQFGLAPATTGARTLRMQLAQFVATRRDPARGVLILVDEAHQLSLPTLKELQGLAVLDPAPLVVLAGEPGLERTIGRSRAQRAVPLLATLQLPRLATADIEGYVNHRLKLCGSRTRGLFERDALAEVERYTGGTPQLVHALCDAAMGLAKDHSSARVAAQDVRDAAQRLKWVEFSARAPDAALADPDGQDGESATSEVALADTGSRREIPPPAPPLVAEIEVRRNGRTLTRRLLQPGRLVVGRAEDADLRLDSRFVSRQHCQIITTSGQCIVEDLASTNGVLVNGRAQRLHRLQAGDEIRVGDYLLVYFESGAAGGR
jgi:general secretion pathway protein A